MDLFGLVIHALVMEFFILVILQFVLALAVLSSIFFVQLDVPQWLPQTGGGVLLLYFSFFVISVAHLIEGVC